MKPWLQLARISNLPTVWTNVAAAWLLGGGDPSNPMLYWLILAGSLLYTGGMVLNDAADIKFDREHRQARPIPSGQVGLRAAWVVGGGMVVVGYFIAVLPGGAHSGIAATLVSAILFYDLYHKQWSGSVVVMGACRALLYLLAASAVASSGVATPWRLNPQVLPYAFALGCYVVGITLAARLEHKKDAPPVFATFLSFLLLYMPALVCFRRSALGGGSYWQLVILALFAALVGYATQAMRKGGPAIGRAVGVLLAGIAVVDALAVSTVSVPVAFAFVALAPLLLLWQRWVPAT